ncbi:RES family NAD+ phosphorylase [Steroidobacter denitrificans]|uniref:RES family NAD+ phosphorylase n=1 Tax=Steroidobacter denitrificans TaxID=465721 RepID=UPI00143ACB74|nr:RES family NAD+ phosphorylase [Steroidobacter denitrificans]
MTRSPATEPYFGKTGGNRFDDPLRAFGVCYAGDHLTVAFAETILHDALPASGGFTVAESKLADRHVTNFHGSPLVLVDLTGASLKRLGGTNEISSEHPYATTQQWARAVYEHPQKVDGIYYVSRHMNTRFAYALFDGSMTKISAGVPATLMAHRDYADVLKVFNVQVL